MRLLEICDMKIDTTDSQLRQNSQRGEMKTVAFCFFATLAGALGNFPFFLEQTKSISQKSELQMNIILHIEPKDLIFNATLWAKWVGRWSAWRIFWLRVAHRIDGR